MSPPPPDWFHNRIVDGVMLLHSLHLDGRPAAEVVTLTAAGWIEVLWRGPRAWDESRDAARLSTAFFALARLVDKWPAPRQLLDNLPPVRDVPALPAPSAPPGAARLAQLAQLKRRLADRGSAIPKMSGVRDYTSTGGACGGETNNGRFADAVQAGTDQCGHQPPVKGI